MSKPLPESYPIHFDKYIKLVADDEPLKAFSIQQPVIESFFDSISEEQSLYAYAEGKWTLKEMLQHMIDTEKIFAYRALCIARKESQSLPGFDENEYADAADNANARDWASLIEEFKTVRKVTYIMFENFTDNMIDAAGLANNLPVTVNAIGFTTVGHVYHHINIIKERYLAIN